DQFSPKVGLLYTPWKNGHFRAFYSKSLGGVYFDSSFRMEPSQVAGFNQAYRSMAPDAVVGPVPGSRFESWGLGFDQSFSSHTYLGVEGNFLHSSADRNFPL